MMFISSEKEIKKSGFIDLSYPLSFIHVSVYLTSLVLIITLHQESCYITGIEQKNCSNASEILLSLFAFFQCLWSMDCKQRAAACGDEGMYRFRRFKLFYFFVFLIL
jgi:hypothetical protein